MLFLLSVLVLAAAEPAKPSKGVVLDGENEVEAVEVRGTRADRLLQMNVSGDTALDTIVASIPGGLYCGGDRYRYARGKLRLCWVRAQRGSDVTLRAYAKGDYGRDWSVEWTGCTPQGDGSTCRLKLAEDITAAARFTRAGS